MKARNNILTNSIDLTSIFIVGGVIDITDLDITTLYAINYTPNDYPINSIDFPNLTSITRNQNNQIDNTNLTNINFPNLTDCYGLVINVNNCDINLQSLTSSNTLSIETLTASTINLNDLQEVNGQLLIDSPNTISLPSLTKVNVGNLQTDHFNTLCNELTCDNLQYVGANLILDISNTINDLDLSQLDYVGSDVIINGSINTDIILTSLTQSSSINIQCASSSNIFLDNFVEVTNTFSIITNAISLTFSNLIAVPQSFEISSCNNLQTLSVPNLDNSPVSLTYNPSLTSIDLSGLLFTLDFSISNNTSLTQSSFNNLIQCNQAFIITNSSLESISFNSLVSASKISIANNTSLETIDLSSLDNIKVQTTDDSNTLYIDENNSNLKSLDISGLITVPSGTIILFSSTGFPNLEEVILNNAVDATNVDIRSANLTQTSVDNILIALDTAGYSGGTVILDGGTSATPGVGGIAAAASLIGKSWTVTTN
jgi:hypothetical protein